MRLVKILHVVPGLGEATNGIAVAAKLIACGQREEGREVELVETREFVAAARNLGRSAYAEVWVHSMWRPETIRACRKVLKAGVPLVRMTHANLDPLRMRSKGWKKLPAWWLIERRLMNRAARVVVTCEAEREWCEKAGVRGSFEVLDLKWFFKLETGTKCQTPCASSRPLRILYLGRRHPLKGVEFLERAVREINDEAGRAKDERRSVELRIVSDHFGEELERDWAWCDALVLPTLSDNLGLVVAEALERGKRVVVTDGAPAWGEGELFDCSGCSIGYGGRLVYLKGYRAGTDATRVKLLKEAMTRGVGVGR